MSDGADAFVNILNLCQLRRPQKIQHFRLAWDDVGRSAAAVGDGVVHARVRDDMLPEVINADIHEFYGV